MALTVGLLAGWKLDEAAGGPYADVLGVSTMTAVGSPGQGTGLLNKAITSPTTSDYAHLTGLLFSSAPWSLSAWINAPDTSATRWLMSQVNTASGSNNGLLLTSTGVQFRSGTGGGTVSWTGSYSANVWNHLAMSYDGTTLNGYVNGVLVISQAATSNYPAANQETRILASQVATGGASSGTLADDCYIWGKVLTNGGVSIGALAGGEIATLYNGGAGSTYPWSSEAGATKVSDGKSF